MAWLAHTYCSSIISLEDQDEVEEAVKEESEYWLRVTPPATDIGYAEAALNGFAADRESHADPLRRSLLPIKFPNFQSQNSAHL